MDNHKYTMTINLNVLNHLGINLYSNVPAVLSEVVANSWDADATSVDINIDLEEEKITITDNGHGMTESDINDKYLHVGYKRRDESPRTFDYNRPVMGRKGIGKLSLFSIADIVEIQTVSAGKKSGFVMSAAKIKSQIEQDDRSAYYPDPLPESKIDLDERGTRIVLMNLKKRVSRVSTYLRKRLARRFGIIGTEYNFLVSIDGKPVEIEDRDYFHKLQYLWYYGEESKKYCEYCDLKKPEDAQKRPAEITVMDEDDSEIFSDSVRGWIGSVRKSGDLRDKDGEDNLNKIVIMVRGKLAQEDILEDFTEGGLYTKYLIGEIHADFLDLDEADDIATSNRQEIIRGDPRYRALQEWVRKELKNIQSLWTDRRNEEGERDARQIPAIDKWMENLKGDKKRHAKALLGKIGQLALDDNQRMELYKYSVLAFENLMHKDRLSVIENLTPENMEEITKIFADLSDIEASHYYQIVSERLQVIEALDRMVEENVVEKLIQDYLPEQFWLLDPSWERAKDALYVEQKVTTAFDKINEKLDPDERKGRIDIRYKKMAGQHVIIELKRPGIKANDHDLLAQVNKYRTALQKQLNLTGAGDDTIEIVCIVGEELRQWTSPRERERSKDILAGGNIRVVLYRELINDALQSYDEFLEKKNEAGRICELIRNIEIDALK